MTISLVNLPTSRNFHGRLTIKLYSLEKTGLTEVFWNVLIHDGMAFNGRVRSELL